MKARIIATGEIVEVIVYKREHRLYMRIHDEKTGEIYRAKDLDFNIEDDNTPDYWEKLKHQYAGMAMQGLITDANNTLCEKLNGNEDVQNANEIVKEHKRIVASICVSYATALIEKLREEK